MFAVVIKERLVNVRLKEQTHKEFKIACDLRGASMSSLLHQFIVRTIREEKEASPQSFVLNSKREHLGDSNVEQPTGYRVEHLQLSSEGKMADEGKRKKKTGTK